MLGNDVVADGGSAVATTGDPDGMAILCAGLATLGTPLVLLDDGGRVRYVTPAARELLGLDGAAGPEQDWAGLWARVCAEQRPLTGEPQRTLVRRGGHLIPVRAWRRPLVGTPAHLVGLEDLSAEDAQEQEVLRIFHDAQQQADDLFALYQITQFLSTAQELDPLCTIFLRELTRLISADRACLYLAGPDGLQPHVAYGLPTPPAQPDIAAAEAWIAAQAAGQSVVTLPLQAEDRLVGAAFLVHHGLLGREARFLHTVAKEMGTALQVMIGRQALLAQEQKLEAIVSGTTDAIIQVGPDRQVRDFNPAAEGLTGYHAADALGASCAAVLGCGPETGCGGSCPFAQVLANREPIPYTELLVNGRAGQRHVAASVAALDLAAPAPPAAVAILRDMTRQKQIEQMKADFLVTTSHQLRTPLALLRGYTDTLLHLDLSPQEQRACVTGLAETTGRLEHLVGQILDVTSIEESRLELHREPVRLVDVLRAAITALPHTAYRSRIWTELAPDLPRIDADPARLEQAVINLLDNALKYSPPTGQVIIRAEARDGGVQVQILDEGIGVPAADQKSIFHKFHRAGNARSLQIPGTGLGLFICRSIITAHGGHITLTSPPGAGTCVTLWLPQAAQGS